MAANYAPLFSLAPFVCFTHPIARHPVVSTMPVTRQDYPRTRTFCHLTRRDRITTQPRFEHTHQQTRLIDSSPFLKPTPPRVLKLSGRNLGLFSLPFLYVFELMHRLAIYVTIQFANTNRKDEGVPLLHYRGR